MLLPSKQDHLLGIYAVELCICIYRQRPFDPSHGANRELKILTPALKLLVYFELQKFCTCSFPSPVFPLGNLNPVKGWRQFKEI